MCFPFKHDDDTSTPIFNEQFVHNDASYEAPPIQICSIEPEVDDCPTNSESNQYNDDLFSESNEAREENTYVPHRSRKATKLPILHKDYQVECYHTKHSITNCVFYEHLSPHFSVFCLTYLGSHNLIHMLRLKNNLSGFIPSKVR